MEHYAFLQHVAKALHTPKGWFLTPTQLCHQDGVKIPYTQTNKGLSCFLPKSMVHQEGGRVADCLHPEPGTFFAREERTTFGYLRLEHQDDIISAIDAQWGPLAWSRLRALSNALAQTYSADQGLFEVESYGEILDTQGHEIWGFCEKDQMDTLFSQQHFCVLRASGLVRVHHLFLQRSQTLHERLHLEGVMEEWKHDLPNAVFQHP